MTQPKTADLLTELVSLGAQVTVAQEDHQRALQRRDEVVAELREQGLTWARLAEVAGVTEATLRDAARKREVKV